VTRVGEGLIARGAGLDADSAQETCEAACLLLKMLKAPTGHASNLPLEREVLHKPPDCTGEVLLNEEKLHPGPDGRRSTPVPLSREVAVVPIEEVHLMAGGGQRLKTGTEPGTNNIPHGEFVEVERGAALSVILLVLVVRHIIVGGTPVVDDLIDLLRFWLWCSSKTSSNGSKPLNECLEGGIGGGLGRGILVHASV